MSYNEYYINKASDQLERRRALNRSTEAMRRREVSKKIPEYTQLESLLAETTSNLIAILIQTRDVKERAEKIIEIENNNLAIQKNMEALLTSAGFPADYLSPVYTCKICRDKGTFEGEWCDCFRRLMLNAAADDLNSVSPMKLSTFDSFSIDYYSDETDPTVGYSPRTLIKHNLDFCKSYAEDFSSDSESIFMNGGTGLGKTHLSLAIADTVIKKGHNVIYGSVPELLRVMEKEYFGKADGNTTESLTSCDLLILDDLGAEPDKPLYTSLMYEVLNARMNRSLPTVVNSNLGVNELKERYHDRIWSRLFSFEVLMFIGSDIRRKIKKKN